MRLGQDVLEADLYGELGLLPDATESEIRAAYRQKVRASHPDLNQADPDAAARMTRLNVAAKVLLDPALRRSYDRASGSPPKAAAAVSEKAAAGKPSRRPVWFDQRERSADDDWSAPPAPRREPRRGSFFSELRGCDGRLSLELQELVESLSARQQLGVAALLFAVGLGLIVMAQPQNLGGDSVQPTSVNVGALFP